MKTAWVTFKAIDRENAQSLETLLSELAQTSKHEHGMVRYEVFHAEDDNLVYYVRESWEDETAMQQHLEQPHLVQFAQSVSKLLAIPFTFTKIETIVSF